MELGILQQLNPQRPIPEVSLYTDDVVLFCHPSWNDLAAITAIPGAKLGRSVVGVTLITLVVS
jgi:hypothetical protein